MQMGFYVEAGTYLAVEIENMKNTVPQLPAAPLSTPTTSKRAPPAHPAKTAPVVETKPSYFFRRYLIFGDKSQLNPNELQFLSSLEETIVKINAQVLNVRDVATVPSMKVEKEDSPAITGVIVMSGSLQIVILEVLEGAPSEELITQFLSERPEGDHLSVLIDENQHFLSPRAYHTFDCAVKKFKLSKPLDEVLMDPAVYVQNSHLSNCFRVLNQLNQIRSLAKFEMANEYKLWPLAQELEMMNAKLGALLTMEELSFPPRAPQSEETAGAQKSDETEEEEAIPVFEYQPVAVEYEVTPPRGWEHYNLRHQEQIQKIRERRGPLLPRQCIASDGEVEIWRDPPDPEALAKDGWIVERPEEYMPLAQAVGPNNYPKMFRQSNGTEIRGEKPFYAYKTPKTEMAPPEQLKADVNKESWQDGDKSLANCDLRWMANVRGPIKSSFTPAVHPTDTFEEFHPISIEEEWRPPIKGTGPRTSVLPVVPGRDVFHQDVPPASKFDCFVRTQKDNPPLTVQEEYQNPPVQPLIGKPPTRGHQRFTAVFPQLPTRKGATDSMTVRKLRPTFP
jgi:hypothetical protein